MNRKIFFSLISIFSTLAVVGGAAFAFFSSNASSNNNVFAAGTLNLKIDDVDEITPVATVSASFGGTNIVPGATASGFVSLHNDGSIA